GQAKKNDAGNPQRLHLAALLHNLIDRLLMDARHRADFLANLRAWTDKHRINQSRRAEPRLSNEAAQRFAPPQAPRPLSWETHSLFAPVDACFTVPAKCSSSASMTDAAVVSVEITSRRTPASRNAFAVTGPTAVIASLSCRARNCWLPSSSPKCWTADGLKNRTASVSPSAICLKCSLSTPLGRRVRYAITSVTSAPYWFNACGKSGFARSLRGTNTFIPSSRFLNSPASAAPVCISATCLTRNPACRAASAVTGPTQAIRSLLPGRIRLRFNSSQRFTTARTACALVRIIQSNRSIPAIAASSGAKSSGSANETRGITTGIAPCAESSRANAALDPSPRAQRDLAPALQCPQQCALRNNRRTSLCIIQRRQQVSSFRVFQPALHCNRPLANRWHTDFRGKHFRNPLAQAKPVEA